MTSIGIRIGTILLTVYALALGVLVGMVMERFRFDRDRAAVLREYEDKTARVRTWLMRLEADTARGVRSDVSERQSPRSMARQ